jgi:hypothetical protein
MTDLLTPRNPHRYAASKLTPAEREQIACRRMDGETVLALAAEYGVSTHTIRRVEPHERT